jgi:dolichyl-diphosphooligosaccharide--protein glycosyltransferase
MGPIAANNAAIPGEQYETAAFIDAHAAEHGYEYPDSYVFSPWSWNRMYNYHVSGESRSYGYAQSHYRAFIASPTPDEAYQRIEGGRADGAYLVTEPFSGDGDAPPTTMQSRLHDRFGSRGAGVAGLGHYRALYASDSGDYKAFRVVPGATIRGPANGTSVRLSTEVEIEGASFTYERAVAVEDGEFAVTVSYPGEYELEGAAVESVTVNESAIANGNTVRLGGASE